jgi:uncharacterized C2H2 Zn-finger protein
MKAHIKHEEDNEPKWVRCCGCGVVLDDTETWRNHVNYWDGRCADKL